MAATQGLKIVAPEDKRELASRLARIEGQIRGIRDMLEREEDCAQVAQQMAAVRSALSKAMSTMIARTIERNCMSEAMEDPEARAKLATIAEIMAKYG